MTDPLSTDRLREIVELEWRMFSSEPQGEEWWWEAFTPFGPYTVSYRENHALHWLLEPFRSDLASNYATPEDAKASAQSDFDTRVRACCGQTLALRSEKLVEALSWAMDEIDVLSNKLTQFGYPQGMALPPIYRNEEFDNYVKVVAARRASLEGNRDEH